MAEQKDRRIYIRLFESGCLAVFIRLRFRIGCFRTRRTNSPRRALLNARQQDVLKNNAKICRRKRFRSFRSRTVVESELLKWFLGEFARNFVTHAESAFAANKNAIESDAKRLRTFEMAARETRSELIVANSNNA